MSVSFIIFDKWKNKCFFLPLEMRHSTETNRISQMSIITSISQSRLKGMESLGNRLVVVHFQRIQDLRSAFLCSNFTHQNRFIIPIASMITIIYFKIMSFKITWLFYINRISISYLLIFRCSFHSKWALLVHPLFPSHSYYSKICQKKCLPSFLTFGNHMKWYWSEFDFQMNLLLIMLTIDNT